MSRLTRTHINALQKVETRLFMFQTMTFRTVLLNHENMKKWNRARGLIIRAIKILTEIE